MAESAPTELTRRATERLRLPPHSVEAEQSLLGGLMLDQRAWDQIADVVGVEDLYRADHRLILSAIAELVERNQPPDAVTVAEHLQRLGQLEAAGGQAYLARLVEDTPSAANIRAYGRIVRDHAMLRQLIEIGGDIAASAHATEGRTVSEIVDLAEQRVFEIADRGQRRGSGFVSLKQILPKTIDRLDVLSHSTSDITGISTGFGEMDKLTAGLQRGELIIIAGRPSMGKSTLAINIAENAALGGQVPAAIFSMEMSAEQLSFRMVSSVGRVNASRLRTGKLSDEDWSRIDSAVSMMSNAPIYIDDSGALTPTEVRARARRLKREHGLGLVIVDYLQLMQVTGTVENRATEISEISRSLKALAKELNVPVVALSQLNRSVEQRTDKRPVMSDLRECVTGDTLVCLTDGRRVPIGDLVGSEPEVWSLDEQQRIRTARADKVWRVGRRPVLRVQLASGRSIRATAEHRLLSGAGWTTVGELVPGTRLGLARRLPAPHEPSSWHDHELILLGHLIGDGSFLKHQPLRYTTASEENSAAVRAAAETLGSRVARHAGRGAWHQLVISGNGNRWHPRGVGAWLKTLGIFNQRSHEKRLPPGVFTLSNAQVALLLRHLWATDGSITERSPGKRGAPRVYFSTCSQDLAHDVAALLLRLGIVARIRSVHSGRSRPVHTVDVSGAASLRLFLDTVGGFGPRAAPAAALARSLESVDANTNVDTLPLEVFGEVRAQMRAQGVTTRAMAKMRGTAYGGSSHFLFSPSRDMVAQYAQLLEAPHIAKWAESDLFWDRVVAVSADGEEDVFDLTVPGLANWLADGIVTHNSGAIEQDADLIVFIYREEVYEPDTPRKGIADIIIGKQRNGPIGEFRLTFLGEFTKFENLVAEAYGEGVF
ncbi:MAG TPA: replicative DNA helicase [Gammaproteobacteria bacterium]|nr:replicative DNA helicase [Gammaproteobacteria bacterium]